MGSITVFLIVISILSGAAAIILFFAFRVPHLVFVLTGIGSRREIRKIERGEVSSKMPSARISFEETTILSEQSRDETVVLSADDIISGLSESEKDISPFRIKKDVVIKKGTQK